MIEMPGTLKLRQKYLMQIIDASSEHQDRGTYDRYRYQFVIRIWPDVKRMKYFYDLTEVFYNSGRMEKYLLAFVENATGCEFCGYDSEVDFTIGAAFWGIITAKDGKNRFGHVTQTFYNIEAVKPLGFYALEEGEEDNDNDTF